MFSKKSLMIHFFALNIKNFLNTSYIEPKFYRYGNHKSCRTSDQNLDSEKWDCLSKSKTEKQIPR